MNDDLSSALGDLARAAARAQATGDTLVTPDVVQRARRGRRRHDVVVGGVSAAAVTAVVLTGGTLLADREPAPPAVTSTTPTPTPTAEEPSPTPTPTSTPGLAPTVLPGADPSAVPGTCGSVLGEAPPQPDDGRPLDLELWPVPESVDAGDPLAVGASWSLGWYPEVSVSPGDGPVFLVTRDGVVVAAGHASPAVTDADEVNFGGIGFDAAGSLRLAVCDPGTGGDVTPGRALPTGTYELHARLDATILPEGAVDPERDGFDVDVETALAVPGSAELHLADGPRTFTVVGEATWPAADERPSGTPTQPTPPEVVELDCGSTPLSGTVSPLFRLDHPTTPITVGVGEPVDLGARLTYVGAGRVSASVHDVVTYLLLRDGVVVGLGWTGPVDDITSHTVLDHGASKPAGQLEQDLLLEACSPEPVGTYYIRAGQETSWTPLRAGDYELLPVVELGVREAVGDDGSGWRDSTGSTWGRAAGTPVPLTVR